MKSESAFPRQPYYSQTRHVFREQRAESVLRGTRNHVEAFTSIQPAHQRIGGKVQRLGKSSGISVT